jgi:hypothetical protein
MTTARADTDATAITLDIDWAPDHAIDHAAEILREHGVRATWLVTHASEAVERLRAVDDFELGIHPNFASASTHGTDFAAVLAHCMELVPEATAMRTHHLFQMTPLFDVVLERTPIRADLSLYLHRAPGLVPVAFRSAGRTLHRFPTYWQDDQAMLEDVPCWDAATLLAPPGLKVFNFHPIHVLLNSRTFDGYRALKDLGRTMDLARAHTSAHLRDGPGTATVFRDVVASLGGRPTWRIRDLVERHAASASA